MSSTLSHTVLVVDDDPDIRSIVASLVTLDGNTAVEAIDGKDAIDKLTHTLPDLVILDLMMPGATGEDVCTFLRRREGGSLVPVIMLTARDSLHDKVAGLTLGADDYLTKPFHYEELQARMRAQLRIRDLQQQLLRSERKHAISQLAGTAAHQLGQPLSAIILNCRLLELLPPDDERYKQALSALTSDAKRMADIVKALSLAEDAETQEYFHSMTTLNMTKVP